MAFGCMLGFAPLAAHRILQQNLLAERNRYRVGRRLIGRTLIASVEDEQNVRDRLRCSFRASSMKKGNEYEKTDTAGTGPRDSMKIYT